MGTRKRKFGEEGHGLGGEDDCYRMQLKIVKMMQEKVKNHEDELRRLLLRRNQLIKAWSMTVFPAEAPETETEATGRTKKRKTEKRSETPVPPTEHGIASLLSKETADDAETSGDSGEDAADEHGTLTDLKSPNQSVSSDAEESSSDEDVNSQSSEPESEDGISSDSDDDKTPVTPAIGETRAQATFPRVNWAVEFRKGGSSSSDSDSHDSDDDVSMVEGGEEELGSKLEALEVQSLPRVAPECLPSEDHRGERKTKKVAFVKTITRESEKLCRSSVKKRNSSASCSDEDADNAKLSTPDHEKLHRDASPEDIFDWNVLGLRGPWIQSSSSSLVLWHETSVNSDKWPKQLASLPCKFGSCEEYVACNEWLIYEEATALLDSACEIQGGDLCKETQDGIEDRLEQTMCQLLPMHRCASDSFYFNEVKALDGPRLRLNSSEVLVVSFPKFPDVKVLALVTTQGNDAALLKTRINLQPFDSKCTLRRMSNMVTLKRQYIALVNFPKLWHSLRQIFLDPLANMGYQIHRPSGDCCDEEIELPKDISGILTTWKEHGIFNNAQLLTMAALLQMKQGILLVQGPPGTGKTSTIVGMISALLIEEPGARILVCAASNAAVDEIASRLMSAMLDKHGKLYSPKSGFLLRFGVPKAVQVACHALTVDFLLENSTKISARSDLLSGASIVCCTLSGSGHSVFDESNSKFDVLIVDEAAQALECETLIAFQRSKGRCVVVGDPCQLPATVIQRPGTAYGRSLFERMQEAGIRPFLMNTQYRMHPEISQYPSARFYHGRLKDSKSTRSLQPIYRPDACNPGISCDGHRVRLGPYCFLDVSWGEEELESCGHSISNAKEAAVVATVVHGVVQSLRDGQKANIGVITPYLAQLSTISKTLLKYDIDESVCEVNTVDGFQGREKDVIVLSCVRAATDKGLGFISDAKRMNVALTRAKHSLIIVGHGDTLRNQSPTWRALLEDVTSRGRYQVLRSQESKATETLFPRADLLSAAAKFHSAQVSPVKKLQVRSKRPRDTKTTTTVEPAASDAARHNGGTAHLISERAVRETSPPKPEDDISFAAFHESARRRSKVAPLPPKREQSYEPKDSNKRMRGAVTSDWSHWSPHDNSVTRSQGLGNGLPVRNRHIYFGPASEVGGQTYSRTPQYQVAGFHQPHGHRPNLSGNHQGVTHNRRLPSLDHTRPFYNQSRSWSRNSGHHTYHR